MLINQPYPSGGVITVKRVRSALAPSYKYGCIHRLHMFVADDCMGVAWSVNQIDHGEVKRTKRTFQEGTHWSS